MLIQKLLDIPGAAVVTSTLHLDARGQFAEWFRPDYLAEEIGADFQVAQANISVSSQRTVRGIHFTKDTPGQAKYVTCVRGAVLDYLVDLRVGSPTFGEKWMLRLSSDSQSSVYVPAGVGHAICSLQDDATLLYLCSATYDPDAERTVWPLDPALALHFPWDKGALTLSKKDASAPKLAEAEAWGWLPTYQG